MSCGGIQDRDAKAPISTNKKYGHAELRLIHVAAAIALAMRNPKLLGYNGTARPDIVIKNPGASSAYRERGRTIM